MDKNFYEFIVNKEHHKFRHTVDWNLAEEYAHKRLSAIERMADRFQRLCEEETAVILENEQIVFLRTVSNLPAIFTDCERDEIKSKHYIHELGFMSNLSPNYYDTISVGLLKKRETADIYGKRAIDNIIKRTVFSLNHIDNIFKYTNGYFFAFFIVTDKYITSLLI